MALRLLTRASCSWESSITYPIFRALSSSISRDMLSDRGNRRGGGDGAPETRRTSPAAKRLTFK